MVVCLIVFIYKYKKSTQEMPNIIQLRRGTSTEWATANPVLADGEIGIDKTTGSIKIGNGTNTWSQLSFFSAGGVSDGDKGDISVSGGGVVWTIDPASVTYAKMQNVTNSRLLGRSAAGAGSPQEITIGSGLSLSGGVLSSTSSGVTDGDKGDISVSGGGASWSIDPGAVTYAKMQNMTDARILGRSAGSSGSPQELTIGAGLSLTGGVLSATGAATGATLGGTLFS